MSRAARDANFVPSLIGVSSIDLTTPEKVAVNPATGAMLIDGASLYADLDTRYLMLDTSNDPLTGTLDLGANSITMTGSLATTGSRVTKGWFTDIEITNMPTVGGTSLSDTFVDVAGDTMTGDLVMGSNDITLNAVTTDNTYIKKITNPAIADMGYEQSSSIDGVTKEYITNKTLHSIAVKGHPATPVNGSFRTDITQDPDTLEIYLRSAWQTIIYDLSVDDGDFRHTPLDTEIYVWRGASVLLGLNGKSIVDEYKVSMGAYPPSRVLNGGTF